MCHAQNSTVTKFLCFAGIDGIKTLIYGYPSFLVPLYSTGQFWDLSFVRTKDLKAIKGLTIDIYFIAQ